MAQKITPFLWFDGKAGEAADFYVSVFKKSKLIDKSPMNAIFELDGQQFMALNGGPMYAFTPAISFFVSCEDQAEIDYYWEKLGAGGKPGRCGWLTDKFGVSWQVVPSVLGSLLGGTDKAGSGRAMQAMFKMDKLDIATLKSAYEGS